MIPFKAPRFLKLSQSSAKLSGWFPGRYRSWRNGHSLHRVIWGSHPDYAANRISGLMRGFFRFIHVLDYYYNVANACSAWCHAQGRRQLSDIYLSPSLSPRSISPDSDRLIKKTAPAKFLRPRLISPLSHPSPSPFSPGFDGVGRGIIIKAWAWSGIGIARPHVLCNGIIVWRPRRKLVRALSKLDSPLFLLPRYLLLKLLSFIFLFQMVIDHSDAYVCAHTELDLLEWGIEMHEFLSIESFHPFPVLQLSQKQTERPG